MKRDATLGQYEFTTSALGFGTAGIFREPSKVARQRLIETALDVGIRHFDTAPIYGLGRSQGELGRLLRGRRDDVVIVTKVGIGLTPLARVLGRVQGPARRVLQRAPSLQQQARQGAASPSSGKYGGLLYKNTFNAAAAQRSLDESLRELGTECIDLLLLHDPEPLLLNPSEMYGLLERARASGKIRSWGVAGEVVPIAAVVTQFPGSTPVVQIRDDIFRPDQSVSITPQCNYLITFGVLGDALPKILAHVTTNTERTHQWNAAVDADCANPHTIATFLLKDALGANARGTVLYSTTQSARIRDAVALFNSDTGAPDPALDAFRQLVATQLGPNDVRRKDDQ